MILTPDNRSHIDGLSQLELLRKWRFAQPGDPWIQGETGEYWGQRIVELQASSPGGHVAVSKALGWNQETRPVTCRFADGSLRQERAPYPWQPHCNVVADRLPSLSCGPRGDVQAEQVITRLVLVGFRGPGGAVVEEYHESPPCTGDPCDCPMSPTREEPRAIPIVPGKETP